jgi:hypothetical protein
MEWFMAGQVVRKISAQLFAAGGFLLFFLVPQLKQYPELLFNLLDV